MPRMMIRPTTRDAEHWHRANDIIRGAAAHLGVGSPEIDREGIVDWGALDLFAVDNAMTATASDWKYYFSWMPS
jgi:hypothetical protein